MTGVRPGRLMLGVVLVSLLTAGGGLLTWEWLSAARRDPGAPVAGRIVRLARVGEAEPVVHIASGVLGLDRAEVALTPETRIIVGDKEGGFADLQEGRVVVVSYTLHGARRLARWVWIGVDAVPDGMRAVDRAAGSESGPAPADAPATTAPPVPVARESRPSDVPGASGPAPATTGPPEPRPAPAKAARSRSPAKTELPRPMPGAAPAAPPPSQPAGTPLAVTPPSRAPDPPPAPPAPYAAVPSPSTAPASPAASADPAADPGAIVDWLVNEKRR